jgi:alkanesulfonate monooxygenase SsuD/methylene tetrahydromethanopterin reductase-like flavin-dependent oxidoreductase (luciferase family)
MEFGVFDHLDDPGLPLDEAYEMRLKLVEAYDEIGLYAYHIAEHHATPLGIGPSPGVFLSAVAQRTRHLRFGPLVYPLPFYHPIRLIEEICMLDQMSGGRFQLGVGQGVSPIELGFYGVDPARASAFYVEMFDVVLRGLATGEVEGSAGTYTLPHVALTLRPKQQPHPPLWYGILRPESTVWAAKNDVNIVTLAPAPVARAITDRYRQEWTALGKSPATLPRLGVERQIVVAESDELAMAIARRAYRRWRQAFRHLWALHGLEQKPDALYPPDFEDAQRAGIACAGSPTSVRDYIMYHMKETGANYLAVAFAFGDMTLGEALHSLDLFARHIMPTLRSEE